MQGHLSFVLKWDRTYNNCELGLKFYFRELPKGRGPWPLSCERPLPLTSRRVNVPHSGDHTLYSNFLHFVPTIITLTIVFNLTYYLKLHNALFSYTTDVIFCTT